MDSATMTDATGPADDSSKLNGAAGESAAEAAKGAAKGTSLAPATDKPSSGIDPFIAIAANDAPAAAAAATAQRPFYAKALDYSAHAAMVVGLVGFVWTVSDHVVSRQPAEKPAAAAAAKHADATPAVAPKPVEVAKADPVDELRKTNQKMASEIRNLRASLEALRTTLVRERAAGTAPDESRAEIRALSASIDSLKSSLAGTKSEQSATLAQLSAKLEKLQREEKAPQVVAEHKPERQQLDTTTTASIPTPPAKAVPTPPAKPTTLASVEPEAAAANADKPQVISGWIVRDVYQGVALIEGRRGQMEVVPGVSIPGAGTVKSIERHNGSWTVTTTKGQFASAAPQQQHEQPPHRGYRDYYGPRRWDF
jgi:hypothetical protein